MRASGPELGWRLLRGRKLTQWVARLAALGVAVGTAAMLVVLAGFNGLETMVRSAYDGIHAPYTLSPAQGQHALIDLDSLRAMPEVAGLSAVVSQKALVRSDKREVLVELWGVDSAFATLSPCWYTASCSSCIRSCSGSSGGARILGCSLSSSSSEKSK